MAPLHVLIADDHPVFRAGLRMLIEQQDDMECVAEAATAQQAVDRAIALKPDVAVIDLRMPDGTGIWATRRIAADVPGAAVLLLTMHEDQESVIAAIHAGARGYAVKGSDEDDIIRAIRSVGRGEAIFAPAVAGYITDLFAGAPSPATRAFPDLTDREREILEQLADGSSNGQIAHRLWRSGRRRRCRDTVTVTKPAPAGTGVRPLPPSSLS